MRILALECATIRCSAAVWEDGAIRAHAASDAAHGATETLVPMLGDVLGKAGLKLGDIDRLGVTIGPGHFTGLRAGLAVARGIVLASGLPAVAVTTLEAIAAATDSAARRGRHVLAAIDSKRTEPFLQIFDATLAPVSEAMACAVDDFAAMQQHGPALLVAGDAGPAVGDALRRAGRDVVLASGPSQPDAAVVAALAAQRKPVDGPLRPFYLHAPAVKLPAARVSAS